MATPIPFTPGHSTSGTFTTEEWNRVLASPMLAGVAVTLAEPSGLVGMLKDAAASGRAVLQAKTAPGCNRLMQAIAEEIETPEGRCLVRNALEAEITGKSAPEIKAHLIAALGEIGRLLDTKAPQDAPAVKAWLQHVAEQVADASNEGGFLCVGGVRGSDAEKASLEEIGRVLNLV